MSEKYVTFSFDDGLEQDEKIIELSDRYGIKCTFNLNSGLFGSRRHILRIGNIGFRSTQNRERFPDSLFAYAKQDRLDRDEAKKLYRNHEVACHGKYHLDLSKSDEELFAKEVIEDKKELESMMERQILGFALPFGRMGKDTDERLKKAGFAYCRTTKSTYRFDFPSDPMKWDPTCWLIDKKLFEIADRFIRLDSQEDSLLYLWGHGYELDFNTKDSSWDRLERLFQILSQDKQIHFLNNSEVIEILNKKGE